jgi:hypothetical protein
MIELASRTELSYGDSIYVLFLNFIIVKTTYVVYEGFNRAGKNDIACIFGFG